MSDSDDSDIPDGETCQRLTEQFAQITNTDVACAQFFLQDRKWDLTTSVNAFFESTHTGGVTALHDGNEPQLVVKIDKAMVNAMGLATGEATCTPPPNFSLISWNLDGLEEHNLKMRTMAVCEIIFQERADIVFLQELIPETYKHICDKLPEYMCIPGNSEGYFTAILLRRYTVYFDSHQIIPFPNSQMLRNLLYVQAHIGQLKLHLLNTHLESGQDHRLERIVQLKMAFKIAQEVPEDGTVVFGGDLNLRDNELENIGGIPPGFEDLWQSCGARQECKFTWDMQRNTNKCMSGRYKPRCRFDRLYLRQAHLKHVTPRHFGLVGIQKAALTQSYPSDHWGISVHCDIEKL